MTALGRNPLWGIVGLLGIGLVVACDGVAAQEGDVTPSPFEPVRYGLDVEVDYEHAMLRGAVSLVVRNRGSEPASVIPLLLNRLLTVREVRDRSGAPADFLQDIVAFVDEPRLQVTEVRVRLREHVPPGETTSIEVVYDGFLTGYQETGSLYIRDAIREDYTVLRRDAYAYPRLGVPSRALNRMSGFPLYEYRARIDVPEGYVVANGGRLLGRRPENGRVTWVYGSRVPSWRMDFAIARYGRLEFGPVTVFYLPGDSTGAERLVRGAERAHETFTKWFGPLEAPPEFAIIEVPDGFGSQKAATAILQVASAFRDAAQLRQIYHEVAHAWIPTQTGASPRVEEGLATFLEHRAVDVFEGTAQLNDELDSTLETLRRWFEDRPEFAEVPMATYGEEGWSDLSYSVGFAMYGLLYHAMGAERFNDFVRSYYACCRVEGASTERLAEEIARAGGPVAKRIVDEWLWTTDWWAMVEAGWTVDRMLEHYDARPRPPASMLKPPEPLQESMLSVSASSRRAPVRKGRGTRR